MTSGLTTEGLNVARGGKAVLHDVDLEILPGKITALLGAKAPANRAWCFRSRPRSRRPAARSRSTASRSRAYGPRPYGRAALPLFPKAIRCFPN